jgi:hypothetical protein
MAITISIMAFLPMAEGEWDAYAVKVDERSSSECSRCRGDES